MTIVEPPADSSVTDWATDFDHTDEAYAAAAPEIWDDLRERCPVAHTDRFGGAWLPTRHDDVSAIAHDTEHFSSHGVIVNDFKPGIPAPVGFAPPITSDPPVPRGGPRHPAPGLLAQGDQPAGGADPGVLRRAPGRHRGTPAATDVDAATDYAQHIPVRVIAHMLGVPAVRRRPVPRVHPPHPREAGPDGPDRRARTR